MEHGLGLQLVLVLSLTTLVVASCRALGLSPILGYLGAGVLMGPAALGWLGDTPATRTAAELGVVLLMFTVGLEFSLSRLLRMKRLVLGLGGAQVGLALLVFAGLAVVAGVPPAAAFILGGGLALSSTAIALKQLGEQRELPAAHGRVATAVLLFQDIAAVPLLVVLPILAAGQDGLSVALGVALLKAVAVFITLVLLGRHVLPPVLSWVGGSHSLELFMLSSLLLALAAAALSDLAGLSPTLGAFMAGMLLGETTFRFQIEADIRPFRDLMMGLFFVTIGMQVDLQVLLDQPLLVSLLWLALVPGKLLLMVPLVRWFGYNRIDSWRSALVLAQGGEFGLLLVAASVGAGLLAPAVVQPVLAALILSMLTAPLLIRFNDRLAGLTQRSGERRQDLDEAGIEARCSDFDQHVIVCGYGRIGQNLMWVLQDELLPAVALDLDPRRVAEAAAAGEPVLYGDAGQPSVLHAAGVERARALVISMDEPQLAARITRQLRATGQQLPILVRSARGRDDADLREAGAEVFPEGLETSLAFAGQLLITLGLPPSQVEQRMADIRAQEYAPLRSFFHSGEADPQQQADYPEQIRSVTVAEHHHASGRTPQQLQLPQLGVELLDLRRGALRVPGEQLDMRLRSGDVVVLKGHQRALDEAVVRLRDGR